MTDSQESNTAARVALAVTLILLPALAGLFFSAAIYGGYELGNFIAISYALWGWAPAITGIVILLRAYATSTPKEKFTGATIAERKINNSKGEN